MFHFERIQFSGYKSISSVPALTLTLPLKTSKLFKLLGSILAIDARKRLNRKKTYVQTKHIHTNTHFSQHIGIYSTIRYLNELKQL